MNQYYLKKFTISMLLILSSGISIKAQSLDLFVFSGYTFGHRFRITGGNAKIYEGHTYGMNLGYNISNFYAFELLYSRQDTRATARSVNSGIDVDEPTIVHYILAGSNRLQTISEKAAVFGGLKGGVVIFAPRNNSFNSITKLAVGFSGGLKYNLTRQVGLRIQTNLNFPLTNVGASLWWSSGSGPSVGVSSSRSIVQFGITGGVFYRFYSNPDK
jgi:hypothetical protein